METTPLKTQHEEVLIATTNILDELHQNQRTEIMKRATKIHNLMEAKTLQLQHEKEQKEFEKFCAGVLTAERKHLQSSGLTNSNFEYVFQRNRQGMLLYPPVFCKLEPSNLTHQAPFHRMIYWIEPHDRYILRSPEFEGNLEAEEKHKIKKVVDGYLREGTKESPGWLDNHFALPAMYTGLGIAFFLKFANSLG